MWGKNITSRIEWLSVKIIVSRSMPIPNPAAGGIPNSIEGGRIVSGTPALDNRRWLRATAIFGKLPELQRRVRELEKQLATLQEHDTDAIEPQ